MMKSNQFVFKKGFEPIYLAKSDDSKSLERLLFK